MKQIIGILLLVFLLPSSTDEAIWNEYLQFFGDCLQRASKGRHRIQPTDKADKETPVLSVKKSKQLLAEAYTLEVGSDGIRIEASTLKGLTRATATLIQLIGGSDEGVPQIRITDQPSVPFRCLEDRGSRSV